MIKLIRSKNTEGLSALSDILIAPILDDNTIIYAYNEKNEILGAIVISIPDIYDSKNHTVMKYGIIDYIASKQKGIGTILIREAEQWFKDHINKMTHPLIHVVSLKTSVGFYLAMGFHYCPEFDENYIGLNTMRKNI